MKPPQGKRGHGTLLNQDSIQQIQNKHITRMIKGIARVSKTVSKYEQGQMYQELLTANHTNLLMVFCPILLCLQYRSLFPEKNQKNILHTSLANDS
jgi:hypothetical protein